ncbi:MAG: hypothetical protein GXP62_04780 [Oligoflexia bacterium]|nr:hypothetical protein [Oligoflexia bacterium]
MTRTTYTIAVAVAVAVCTSILCVSCGKAATDEGTATTPTADCGSETGTTPTGTADSGWTEKEKNSACIIAEDNGYWDAMGVMNDCKCVEQDVYDTWSLSDYTTDYEKTCYIAAWGEAFLQACTETCWVKGPVDKCCMDMVAWAVDQYP